ncbi:MAG: hypothetical protein Q8N55_00640 [bacterium]|nr:hypothetical protein [bacterium]
MTFGFIIQRNTYYKFFGCLIDEALKRGHKVFCFHDYSQPQTGKKGYQFPHLRQSPRFKNGSVSAISFQTEEELMKMAIYDKVDAFVSLHFLEQYTNLRKLSQKAGIKWVALQHGLDSLGSVECLKEPDLYLFYSKEWLKFAFEFLAKKELPLNKELIESKVKFIGFPELDQAQLINPYEIKAKWGIPENQKVVLFLPFPFGATNDRFWSQFIFGNTFFPARLLLKKNDFRFCMVLKDFCKRNDVFLLVKSRRKDPVKPYLSKIADKVLYDEQEYPSTIIECFSISNLCLNFVSTAVTESVALGCPNISILPSKAYKDIQNPLWELLLNQYRDLFDFKGATQLVSITDAFKLLKEKTLNDFTLDIASQQEYVKKYIGSNEPSKRAVDEIERMVK